MNLYEKHILNISCPNCRLDNSLVLQGKLLYCKNKLCDFREWRKCPICDFALNKKDYHSGSYGAYFVCRSCESNIGIKKIKYLIENGLYVDKSQRCPICDGPTIPYDKDNSILYKCFFFPKCDGKIEIVKTKKKPLVFLDFETTGFMVAKNSIIEIGAVKIDEYEGENYFQTFVKPRNKVRQEITDLTGITNKIVKNAPLLKDSISNLIDFIGDSTIVTHNISFDIRWLLTATIRHNIEIHDNPAICTLQWARQNNEKNCSLEYLTKRYDIKHCNKHRALDDANATKDLYFIYKNMEYTQGQLALNDENMKQSEIPLRNIEEYREASLKLVEKYKKYFQP